MMTLASGDPRKVTHAACVASCMQYLGVVGAFRFKVWGGPMQRPGLPDILACLKGRLIAVECKVAKDRLRAEQRIVKAEIEAAGGIYILAKEGAAADVEARLASEGLVVGGLL